MKSRVNSKNDVVEVKNMKFGDIYVPCFYYKWGCIQTIYEMRKASAYMSKETLK